ncbi:hypothetical protein GGF32_004599 [Allomyces javanicus]|nr:hypothetical protein GGF32_004599 [Allomyces javanicus]
MPLLSTVTNLIPAPLRDTAGSACTALTAYVARVLPFAAAENSSVPLVAVLAVSLGLALALRRALLKSADANKRLPPSPPAWPIIGHLPLMASTTETDKVIQRLAKEYGPIYHLKLGNVTVIVISNEELARETLIKHGKTYAGRFCGKVLSMSGDGGQDLAMAPYGERWRHLRRIAHKILTPLALTQMDVMLENESLRMIQQLLEHNDKHRAEPIDIAKRLILYTCNIIAAKSLGITFASSDNATFTGLIEAILEVFVIGGVGGLEDYFNGGGLFDYVLTKHKREAMERIKERVHNGFIFGRIRELEAIIKGDLAQGRDPRTDRELCYAEELLLTMDEEKLTLNDIKLLMVDFMFAGIDTTSATLHWVMLYLCNNPQVQKRAQAEADRIVKAHGRLPCFEDMDAMPYTRAIIKEATRIRPVGPLGLPRQTIEEDTVAGYYIPKDAQVIYNTVGIHEGLYPEDTEKFKPERWLAANFNDSGNGPILPAAVLGGRRGSDLKTVSEDGAAPSSAPDEAGHRLDLLDGIYLFGQGRRLCPGVHLALREMFILVSRLSACVTLDSALHPGKPFSDEAQFGLTALPKEKVLVTATERDPAMREMLNMEKRQVMKRRVSLSVHT